MLFEASGLSTGNHAPSVTPSGPPTHRYSKDTSPRLPMNQFQNCMTCWGRQMWWLRGGGIWPGTIAWGKKASKDRRICNTSGTNMEELRLSLDQTSDPFKDPFVNLPEKAHGRLCLCLANVISSLKGCNILPSLSQLNQTAEKANKNID